MAQVFVSHSSKDNEFVRRLVDDLKALGHSPWLDQWEIRVGDCIVSKVQSGLKQADYVVVVLSPDAVESGWVEREWKQAYWTEIESRRIVVLPLLLRQCELPTLLQTKRYADFTNRYELGLAQLAQAILPSDSRAVVMPAPPPLDDELTALLIKLHARQPPLAECVAEALSVGRTARDESLIAFCTNELAGWPEGTTREADHRAIEVFCSPNRRPNPDFWGQNIGGMFADMAEDENFVTRKLVLRHSLSRLERFSRETSSNSYMTFDVPLSAFLPDADKPDIPISCFGRGSAYADVVEATRTELTKRLVSLLPPAPPRRKHCCARPRQRQARRPCKQGPGHSRESYHRSPESRWRPV
jgi:hypothetical protein